MRWATAGYEGGKWASGSNDYDDDEATAGYHLALALGRFRHVSRVADLALRIACDEGIHWGIRRNANTSLPLEKVIHELRLPTSPFGPRPLPEQCG